MQDKQRYVVWAAVVLVLIIAAVFFGFSGRRGVPAPTTTGPSGPAPTYAPKGELISGFPKELILDSAARVGNSYSINYSASLNQYTAVWSSSSSAQTLLGKYQTYLSANGWTIPAGAAKSGKYGASVYATNVSSVVNIAIAPAAAGKGSQVTISYVAK